jgi:hypothetical protein
MARAKPYAATLAASIDASALRVVRARRKSRGLRFAEDAASALVKAPRAGLLPAELRILRLRFVVSLLLGAAVDEMPTPPRVAR